jgi:hypothetical protein
MLGDFSLRQGKPGIEVSVKQDGSHRGLAQNLLLPDPTSRSFRATHCKRRAAGRYRCDVSWRHGSYAFAGTAEIGSVNVYTGTYRYGLRVVRTDVRTHRRRTFTVAYY